ncbi:hypothetical protein ADL00_42320 [Streptomyces sp. AS58]|uniref:helix-turn-helix transcriptional regulator n=1 Tax=Streptomyces TaxID=1883 RepID=UPI0006ADDD3C|nr:LuxR family transcriptional regulator [Streptomyces sp. AS58]KOV51144.1 hypothetical protein ADL00_42320 [Streptomyces sp. AS58]
MRGLRESAERPELIGRTAELAMLGRLIEQVSCGGASSVLLHGAAGVGKSALLDAVAARANGAGFQVLRATGVESEVTLPWSGLHHLLYGLRDELDRLQEMQREVLERLLGLSPGPAPDRFAVSAAVLALLHALAEDRPVLLVLDDAQWLDEASERIIAFVLRRLAPKRIGCVSAVRAESKVCLDTSAVSQHRVEPLDAAAAAALLDSRSPGLAPAVRRRMLDEAAGNPLALLELPAHLSEEQLSGSAELPGWFSLSHQLESLYADRVRSLPKSTRDLLLLAAFDTTGSLRAIWSALPGGGKAADCAVVPAERAALVRIDSENGRLVFRHPLVRSVIVQLATPDRRRSAHRALGAALVDEPERQIGHLIAGHLAPDDVAAQTLESAAHRAARCGASNAAISAFRHASALSLKPQDRSRRLAMAAFASSHAGRLDTAADLLRSLSDEQAEPEDAARAATAAAIRLIHRDGDVLTAHRLLVRALDDLIDAADVSPVVAQELTDDLFYLLIEASTYGGGPQLWEEVAARVGRVSEFAKLGFDALADPVRCGRTVGPRLRRAFDMIPEGADPKRVTQLAHMALYCDDLGWYRGKAARAAEVSRAGGAFAGWAATTLLLALDSYHTAGWSEAEAMLRDGLRVAQEFGYTTLGSRMRYQLALIEAGRGRVEAVEALVHRIVETSLPQGLAAGEVMARQPLALLALGNGDYETAFQHCARISPPGRFPAYSPWVLWSLLDLVEAAVMTGRTEEARAHVAAAVRADVRSLSPRVALVVAGAVALTAPDDEAQKRYEEALALPDTARYGFECARIRLAYGQWLIEQGRCDAARHVLRCALATLENLEARPWVERARAAYGAAGAEAGAPDKAAGVRRQSGESVLTSRELEIANLAATGKSNKEIAEQLFLSQRTVSTHLYNIFPKLGINSRAGLRDALLAL